MSTPPRHRPHAQVHTAFLPVVLALVSGVGCDSLLGENGLDGAFGTSTSEPGDVAWELRWFQGPGAGLVSQCDLLEPGDGSFLFDYDFGTLEAPPPSPGTPLATLEGAGFSWSLAALAVVDADSDVDRPASDSDPLAGVWGLAPLHGLLHLSGDAAAFEQALDVEASAGAAAFVQGFQTVEIFPEAIVANGDLVGAMQRIDPTIVFSEEDGALIVDPVDIVDPATRSMALGEGIGGLTFEVCP